MRTKISFCLLLHFMIAIILRICHFSKVYKSKFTHKMINFTHQTSPFAHLLFFGMAFEGRLDTKPYT